MPYNNQNISISGKQTESSHSIPTTVEGYISNVARNLKVIQQHAHIKLIVW